MGQIFKNVISFFIIALILFLGYLLFVEKRSIGELLEFGKDRVEDKALELKVKSQISFKKQFDGEEINVEAEDGIVTLTGTVGSAEKALLAAQIADSVKGVERVINKIKVSTELNEEQTGGRSEREKMLDIELMEKIEAMFETSPDMTGAKIRVIVFKRVVFLEGTVLEERQKDLAVKLARSIDKTRDVKEDLRTQYD